MNFYSKQDPERGTGTGLSDIDTGIRLRYEFSRKFALRRLCVQRNVWQYSYLRPSGWRIGRQSKVRFRGPVLVLRVPVSSPL
jgi:hypothetical protein